MKQKGKWLAWLSLFVLLCSCQADKEEFRELTPLVLGDISVGIQSRATPADAFFLQDDKTTVTATPITEGGKVYTTTFSYRKSSNSWASLGTPIYLDEVYQWNETTHLFQVSFGSEELVTDQSTMAGFHLADYLTGEAELDPVRGRLTAETLSHQQVLIEAILTPGEDWGEDAEDITEAFATHLETVTALFHADEEVKGFGIYREDEGTYVFSAILPVDQVPASGETLFTLSLPNGRQVDCIYTVEDEQEELAAGKVLRVTASYDAMSLLSVTSVTFTLWTDAETAELGGNQTALDSFLAWAARCRAVTGTFITEGYTLTANIDLTGIDWEPIAMGSQWYKGEFDGGGYTISGLNMNEGNTIGLFGLTYLATIKNLHLSHCEISGNMQVGSFVGYAYESTITNCSFTGGRLSGYSQIGGIVAYSYNTIISHCTFSESTIICENDWVGGIAGFNSSSKGSIHNCVSKNSTIIAGTGGRAGGHTGGIVGYNDGAILACRSIDLNISAIDAAGGIVGVNNTNKTVTLCYTDGLIIRVKKSDVGGIVGENHGKVNSCYSAAKEISAEGEGLSWGSSLHRGGLVGDNSATVSYSHFLTGGDLPEYAVGNEDDSDVGCGSFTLPVGDYFDTDRVNIMNVQLDYASRLQYGWLVVPGSYPSINRKSLPF